jgi:VWFA-related protein
VGDEAGAIAAYSGALESAPGAQSASIALASLLFTSDRRDEASRLVSRNPVGARGARSLAVVSGGRLSILARADRRAASEAAVTRHAASIAGCALLAQVLGEQAPQPPAVPAFTSGTVTVMVPVTVLSRNVPVLDLTVADFVVLDNGVRQRIREVGSQALPGDVTLIVDTSGSTAGILDRLVREAGDILAELHPTDRYRVMTIGTSMTQVSPMQAVSAAPLFHPPAGGGMSAVYDALAAALMHPATLDRRHLVAAMTDGIDSISTIGLARLREIARRSEAVLHVLMVASSGPSNSSDPVWLPYQERDPAGLAEVAALTGGRLHDLRPRLDAFDAFSRVLGDFRRSYVLRYTPEGVTPGGWHELEVTVTRPGRYTVLVRNGYFGPGE